MATSACRAVRRGPIGPAARQMRRATVREFPSTPRPRASMRRRLRREQSSFLLEPTSADVGASYNTGDAHCGHRQSFELDVGFQWSPTAQRSVENTALQASELRAPVYTPGMWNALL